jgi:hypothetical protein
LYPGHTRNDNKASTYSALSPAQSTLTEVSVTPGVEEGVTIVVLFVSVKFKVTYVSVFPPKKVTRSNLCPRNDILPELMGIQDEMKLKLYGLRPMNPCLPVASPITRIHFRARSQGGTNLRFFGLRDLNVVAVAAVLGTRRRRYILHYCPEMSWVLYISTNILMDYGDFNQDQ